MKGLFGLPFLTFLSLHMDNEEVLINAEDAFLVVLSDYFEMIVLFGFGKKDSPSIYENFCFREKAHTPKKQKEKKVSGRVSITSTSLCPHKCFGACQHRFACLFFRFRHAIGAYFLHSIQQPEKSVDVHEKKQKFSTLFLHV